MRRDEELVRSAQARFIADELETETGLALAEKQQRELVQVKLEKEMEITDALLKGSLMKRSCPSSKKLESRRLRKFMILVA